LENILTERRKVRKGAELSFVNKSQGPSIELITKKSSLNLTKENLSGSLGNLHANFIPAKNYAILLLANPGRSELSFSLSGGQVINTPIILTESGLNVWFYFFGIGSLILLVFIPIIIIIVARKCIWIIEIFHNDYPVCEPKLARFGFRDIMSPNKSLQQIVNHFDKSINASVLNQYRIIVNNGVWKLIHVQDKPEDLSEEEAFEPEEIISDFNEYKDDLQSLVGTNFSINIKSAKDN
jgi:hypothetical protein